MNCGGAVKLFKRRSETARPRTSSTSSKSDSEYCSAGNVFLKGYGWLVNRGPLHPLFVEIKFVEVFETFIISTGCLVRPETTCL